MSKLKDRFIEGLRLKYNLSYEYVKENFIYCGGDTGRHLNYFKIFFKEKLNKTPKWFPKKSNNCVCGHYIQENCLIVDKNTNVIINVGNCCIKRFIPKNTRTCEICNNPHNNRIVNRCNDCRIGICDKCDKPCKEEFKLCFNCYNIQKNMINYSLTKIIPFGKYKGTKYIDILIEDKDYLLFLLRKDWFEDKEIVEYILQNYEVEEIDE